MAYGPTSPATGVTGRAGRRAQEIRPRTPRLRRPCFERWNGRSGEFDLSRFERSRANEMNVLCRAPEHNAIAPGHKGGFPPRSIHQARRRAGVLSTDTAIPEILR
jgi:hypothetical protein